MSTTTANNLIKTRFKKSTVMSIMKIQGTITVSGKDLNNEIKLFFIGVFQTENVSIINY